MLMTHKVQAVLRGVLFSFHQTYVNPRYLQRSCQKNYNNPFNKKKIWCSNCNEPGQFTMYCPKLRTMIKTMNSIIRNYPHFATCFLFQIFQ